MSSFGETLHREHLERQERFARAAANPKRKAKPIQHEIPNTPYGVKKVSEIEPQREPVKRRAGFYKPTQSDEAAWRFVICGTDVPQGWPINPNDQLKVSDIQRAVCEHYDVSRTDLNSERRGKRFARPRQVGMYLTKRLTTKSFPEIGRLFGDRDHSTAIHAVRITDRRRQADPHLQASIDMLVERLGGDPP